MMTWTQAKEIIYNSIWKQNQGVVAILGMCPVLVMSSNIINGVSLGLATSVVMLISGAAIAAIREFVPNELRAPIFILIIAALVTMVDLLMNSYVHDLYLVLGIFIPLITTNCIVLARAEAFASKNTVSHSALDGFFMGLGLTLVLAILGAIRELIGKGTLLSGIDLVFGPGAKAWVIHVIPAEYNYQFLLAILPPGAFIGLGFLIAGKMALDRRAEAKAKAAAKQISAQQQPA
ncbi:electron transport complex subunit E [Chitinibacter fontanus]|uniref:Ion-translocating oxidoreductase complex subunit E n=1 Tax=Chitinibacter fontanus TaxID=1737446 RepID=A0A7D5V8R5_9NEIS|nr:electron transport complex subunit E [Chitinibacter fontanus]QLI80838.1 electron transport complex subunit E [Chitinibacter fontanus]